VPLLDLFWSMLWFFMFFLWIWLLISLFADIFRSDDLSGWGKAGWVTFLIVVPWLGALVYLIARGGSMQERSIADMMAREQATRSYIRDVATTSSTADELAKLASLHDRGVLSDQEFSQQKAAVLS
jgi:hypothetical protein